MSALVMSHDKALYKSTDTLLHDTVLYYTHQTGRKIIKTRIWADFQRDGRPVEYWRPVLNATKLG